MPYVILYHRTTHPRTVRQNRRSSHVRSQTRPRRLHRHHALPHPPYHIMEGAAEFIDFLVSDFGSVERFRLAMPLGGIGHAEAEIDGAALMLADALPPEYPPTRTLTHLYVADCDAVYARALHAGAASVAEPADQFYGDRLARVTDPFGNQWSISTHIENLTPEQVAQRVAEMGEGADP